MASCSRSSATVSEAQQNQICAYLSIALLVGLLANALAGWWWGGVRLDALDRSVLFDWVDRAERSIVEVTGPARRGRSQGCSPLRA